MSRIHETLSARSRLAVVLLLLAGLLCFGLGQVLGHPLLALPASSSAPHHAMARQVTLASGALAPTPSSALTQPLAAPPARPTATAKADTHHSDHAQGGHHGNPGGSGGGAKHGNGHHHGNGGDN